jgi:hypothetical protein
VIATCEHGRLVVGCDGCIHRRDRDQFSIEVAESETADLVISLDGVLVSWKRIMVESEIARRVR